MAVLLDLSNELLLEIVSLANSSGNDYNIPRAKLLSLTCKRFNACCAPYIFKEYKLSFRHPSFHLKTPSPLDKTDIDSSESWNLDVVKIRLDHLRDKARFIQKLTIDSEGRRGWGGADGEPNSQLPAFMMPDLIRALQRANQVTRIHIYSNGILPLPLWEWITTRDLEKLSIWSSLAPPPNAMVHTKVQRFEGGLFKNSLPFLKLIRATTVKLAYHPRTPKAMIAPYKPSSSDNPQLRELLISVTLTPTFEKPLFDFSGIPAATIQADFGLGVEYKMHIPAAWKRLKHDLPTVFAEGLDEYDVQRSRSSGAHLTRPTRADIEAGWKPENAVHLEGEAEERREAEEMEAYYAMRMRQQMPELYPDEYE